MIYRISAGVDDREASPEAFQPGVRWPERVEVPQEIGYVVHLPVPMVQGPHRANLSRTPRAEPMFPAQEPLRDESRRLPWLRCCDPVQSCGKTKEGVGS